MSGDAPMIRAVRGPVTLIVLGALFALNNFTEYRFSETWPILLIVFGVLSILGRTAGPPPPPYGYPPQPGYPPRPGYPPPPYPQAAPPRPENPAPPPPTGESR